MKDDFILVSYPIKGGKIMYTHEHDGEYDNEYECEKSENISGNVIDLDLKKCDSEVRADIKVIKNNKACVRVWGQIKDCEGKPVKDALVKLLKSYYYHGKIEFEGVAHTTTDCMGFYQFEVCLDDEHDKFRIIVGKSTPKGRDRVIREKGFCNPCDKEKDEQC
jgi:hypothetical protein